MSEPSVWNPLTSWKAADIKWDKVEISKQDLQRFNTRSNVKGLIQSLGFLLTVAATGALAYLAYSHGQWVLMVMALYLHGLVYGHFGSALHELSHNTVFASRRLSRVMTALFGWLNWPYNPYMYRLSHQGYHHRYTLHQGADGEDVPNYVELTPRFVLTSLFKVLHLKLLAQNLARLFTLKPTTKGWRGRGYGLDTWEQFVLANASEKKRKQVSRFSLFNLVAHVGFVAVCIVSGHWFLAILITFAPFYGPDFHLFYVAAHQHSACDPNHPDFRESCGSTILDPISSFLYWHMEYHIEHHMFASIPCYNLKAFSAFLGDQLPVKQRAWPRLLKLNTVCREKYGSWQYWRDNFGLYKGY